MEQIDLFVIGGGSGGVRAARKASEQGAKVVLAESSKLGGTCVNLGCVPKKLLSYATDYRYFNEDASCFGWQTNNEALELDWNQLRDNKDKRLASLNDIYATNLDKAGVEVVFERARITGVDTVVAGDKTYQCKTILIATGGYPAMPPTSGFKEFASVSDDIFSLPELPKRAVVGGAGYIAVEFACILAGFGVDVTLVHRGPTILKTFDVSIQNHLLAEMKHLGIKILLNHLVEKLEKNDSALLVTFTSGETLEADLYLAATGRKNSAADLGLEETGVEMRKNGSVIVDENYCTNVPTIFALGDIIGKVALTPVAIAEAMYFVSKRYGGYGPPVNYSLIPTAVFTHPNVSTVGMTEEEAKQKYPDCEIFSSEFKPMRHSMTNREEKTLMKLVCEANNGRVLGAHMVGPDAGELMQGIAVALAKNATKYDFDATIGIHPTSAEEFVSMR